MSRDRCRFLRYQDGVIANTRLGNSDWPGNNFRFAWDNTNSKAVFLPWDLEKTLQWIQEPQIQDVTTRLYLGGAAEPFLQHLAGRLGKSQLVHPARRSGAGRHRETNR